MKLKMNFPISIKTFNLECYHIGLHKSALKHTRLLCAVSVSGLYLLYHSVERANVYPIG